MNDYHHYIYDTENRIIIGDFDAAYANCDDVWPSQHDIHTLKFRTILNFAKETKKRVLDIGAGYGDFIHALQQNDVSATGIEISQTAVEIGKKRHKNIDLRTGNLLEGLSFSNESYDIVVLYGVMWFLLDGIDSSLREIDRILTPNGMLAVSLSMPNNKPIGNNIIGSYDDFIEVLRRKFQITETTLCHDHLDLQKGIPIKDCKTDMVAFCRKV